MAHELTFEQIQSCKKVFDSKKIVLEDDSEDARMYFNKLKEAIDAIEELKHKLTDEECSEIRKNMINDDEIDFPTFLRIAATKFKKQEFLNALIESFRAFDKGNNGNLSLQELRSIITDYGPKISIDEADRLFTDLDLVDINDFNYKEFVNNNI